MAVCAGSFALPTCATKPAGSRTTSGLAAVSVQRGTLQGLPATILQLCSAAPSGCARQSRQAGISSRRSTHCQVPKFRIFYRVPQLNDLWAAPHCFRFTSLISSRLPRFLSMQATEAALEGTEYQPALRCCERCGNDFQLRFFAKKAAHPDGINPLCRGCMHALHLEAKPPRR